MNNKGWVLEHASVRNGKVYRHEYREHEDGSREWRSKTVTLKNNDKVRPWEVEMELAMESMR